MASISAAICALTPDQGRSLKVIVCLAQRPALSPNRIRRLDGVAEAGGEAAVVMAAGVGSAPSEARAGAR